MQFPPPPRNMEGSCRSTLNPAESFTFLRTCVGFANARTKVRCNYVGCFGAAKAHAWHRQMDV